jgi:two-component system chemotaxis sensor kinase CheA
MDDLRAELLAAFEAELADHLAAIRAALPAADAGREVDLRELSRRAHSLKGAARAVDQPHTEALAHDAEALLLAVEAGERELDAEAVGELRRLTDAIEAAATPAAPPSAEPQPERASDDRLRVGGQHVERIARSIHELSSQAQDAAAIGEALAALETELSLLGDTADKSGAEDVARRLVRATADVQRLRRTHDRQRNQTERTLGELERDAERILLVPVATLFDGYAPMVRELAASQDKAAALHVDASAGECDRRVLQSLREPLLHMLRNAVGHGIEVPAERRRAGKPDEGEVTITATLDTGWLTLIVADDGRGLDLGRIEARARSVGLIEADARPPPRERLCHLVFEQGFSTAQEVDAISGRGIGLAVVAEAARRLHGRVAVTARAGGGTEIRLSVPSSLTRQAILLVEAGGERYGIPAEAVAELARALPDQVDRSGGGERLTVAGRSVPLRSLATLVGATPGAIAGTHHSVLVLDSDGEELGLVVDVLEEVRSLVVGDPVAIAADSPLVYGTALVHGGVALVLSPAALLAQARGSVGGAALAQGTAAAAPIERKTVLVVDDSITTRTLERSILEAQGYAVLVSVDGLAALERLRSGAERIDLVVADVEMPRMDGFGLLQAIRNDPGLSALPVVMMTSRNSPDDIQRGLDLGANAYVTKQEFDQGHLIAIVQQLV